MTLRMKLWGMCVVSTIGLLAVAAFWIQGQHATLLQGKMEKARELVEVPYSIIEQQYQLETTGKISRAEAQRRAIDSIRGLRYQSDNYFWINDEHPNMIMHPMKPALDGTDLSSLKDPSGKAVFVEFVRAAQPSSGGFVRYLWPRPGADQPVPKLSYVKRFLPWGWVIGTGTYIDDVDRAWRRSAWKAGGLALICLIPVLATSLGTSRAIFIRLCDFMNRFKEGAEGEGNLTRLIDVTSEDELGKLAMWFNSFMGRLDEMIRVITPTATEVVNASGQVDAASQQISVSSGETSAQADLVATASRQVSQNLQTVAIAAEQMGVSIREIAKNAAEAAKVADSAVRSADATTATVSRLGESSAKIGEVVKVISGIAQQTNLLALNAAIEAARAGAAGRGFGVVANEVKSLAEKTAEATTDISEKIAAIQADAEKAVQAIHSIGIVINQINDISRTIAAAVEEQNATTNEMSRNVSEAAQGSAEINGNIARAADAAQGTARSAGEIRQASMHMLQISEKLCELIGQFKIGRREERLHVALTVRVTGTDATGQALDQDAKTINISARGALLQDVRGTLKPSGKITLARLQKKEQFRVAWVGAANSAQQGHVGVFPVESHSTFFSDVLEKLPPSTSTSSNLRAANQRPGSGAREEELVHSVAEK